MDQEAARPPARESTSPRAWIGLGVLLLLGFVAFLDRQIISLMVDLIKRDLRISDSHIGILQGAAFGLLYPFFAVPLGHAADRYSRRWVIFWGVFFWAIAAMMSGLARSFDTLLAARIGVGIGEAALGPAAASLLSDMFPKHRLATVFSIYASGALLGAAGALAIGGAVIAWAGEGMDWPLVGYLASWQIAFIVTGAPALVLAALVFLAPDPKRAQTAAAATAPLAPWSDVFAFVKLNWAYLSCYVLGQSCLLIITWGALAWTPAILERSYGWTTAQVGAWLGLFTLICGLPGQMTNGIIVDRMYSAGQNDAHLRYYALATIAITVSGVAAPFAANAWVYLAITAPSKFLMNYGGVFSAALQIATPSRLRGRITALTGVATAVTGASFGPSIVAFFTDVVFRDDAKVIWSLALTTAIFIPLAGIMFALGMKPMRAAVLRGQDEGVLSAAGSL